MRLTTSLDASLALFTELTLSGIWFAISLPSPICYDYAFRPIPFTYWYILYRPIGVILTKRSVVPYTHEIWRICQLSNSKKQQAFLGSKHRCHSGTPWARNRFQRAHRH